MRHSGLKAAVLAAAFFLILLLSAIGKPKPPVNLEAYMEKHGEEPLVFSCQSGVYDSDISLEIEAPGLLPEGAVIRYTLDGKDPTKESALYEEPILLTASAGTGAARTGEGSGTGADGAGSGAATGAAGADGAAGKDTDDPAAGGNEEMDPAAGDAEIAAENDSEQEEPGDSGVSSGGSSGDKDDLRGADYSADNPAANIIVYTVRAGIFFEEEATATQYTVYCLGGGLFPLGDEYVVCIDTDPVGLYDYDTGILVGGKDLDEHDQSKFHGNYMKKGSEWVRACHVSLFDGDGTLLTDCNAGLAVSGGMSRRLGQKSFNLSFGEPYGRTGEKLAMDVFPDSKVGDFAHVGEYTHLRLRVRSQIPRTFRETLVGELADKSSCRLVTRPRSGIVFLNGTFYSLAELSPTFSSSYISHRFDLPDSDHIRKKKGKDVSVFRKMDVLDLFEADLTLEENRKALEAAVDMDDFLLFYAFDCLDNNLDWPRNNVEAWCWTGEYDPDRFYTDGRLRFMIYDADKTYNTNQEIVGDFGTDSFVSMMENKLRGYESPFRFVMMSDEYRDRFVTILCDLMNTSFDTDHVLSLMQDAYLQREEEYRAFFSAEYFDAVEADYTAAQTEAASYNNMIRQDLADYFGLTEQYQMRLSSSSGVSVTWNNMYLAPDADYDCSYYTGVPITYTATASPGWRFDHWEINGKEVETKEFTLTVDGNSLRDGACSVRAVAVPEEGERLIIAEISASGSRDWIRLYNAGTTPLNLGNYCISDDPERLHQFRLPKETLYPGESCRINGSGNDSGDALCMCSFGLRKNEILFLTPDEGRDVPADSLRVPGMSEGGSYGRRDNGGIFAWFDNRVLSAALSTAHTAE